MSLENTGSQMVTRPGWLPPLMCPHPPEFLSNSTHNVITLCLPILHTELQAQAVPSTRRRKRTELMAGWGGHPPAPTPRVRWGFPRLSGSRIPARGVADISGPLCGITGPGWGRSRRRVRHQSLLQDSGACLPCGPQEPSQLLIYGLGDNPVPQDWGCRRQDNRTV